jgi:N-acetylneuraminic acid mutarotase
MIEARAEHTATLLLDGTVLVAGDGGGGHEGPSAELYDPDSGSWTATGGTNVARRRQTTTLLLDGRVLVAGGLVGGVGALDVLASAELYDPDSGSWTVGRGMKAARWAHTATLLPDGKVLVVGGYSGGDRLASAELYDPSNGRWTSGGTMTQRRGAHTATLLPDGKVLVAGGSDGGNDGYAVVLASAELYDPGNGSWTATGAMNEGRAGATATLLPAGKVLVVGGGGGGEGTVLASAELYDSSSGRWTNTGSMIEGRGYLTATLLRDGQVLVAGGGGGAGPNLASAELYDPDSGSWTATAKMDLVRLEHTATRLLDGRVLVAGGLGGSGPDGAPFDVLASAELYQPGSGYTEDEAYLLSGLRSDARFACAARRVDLPAGAVAGVECSPEVDLVDRIGVYLFTAQDELLEAYFDRLADYGVEPGSGSCPKGAGEHAYVPGDSGPTIGPYRYGCYLNEFGNANYRFTVPNSLVYVGILGTGESLPALHEWAWLGNRDTPGSPTVWRGQVR